MKGWVDGDNVGKKAWFLDVGHQINPGLGNERLYQNY